ncbi:MAG: autotransporter-associated beta strand repeat-containing protein [Kiritimatiellae bacterium]|nr:autotransporter-associated beta strand repeat-containing protein [Kiritimatiellia bacterium]
MKKIVGLALACAWPAVAAFAGTDGALKFTRVSPGGSAAWVTPADARIPTTNAAPFVIEFWIKLAAGADAISEMQVFDQDISGNAGRMLIGIIKGVPRFQIGGTQQNANKALTPGVWHHLACRRASGGGMYVYIDGQHVSAATKSNTAALATTDIVIGYLARATSTAFDGELAEVRVWEVDRSEATIRANYTRRMKGTEAGLRYCWPMDDGAAPACRELVAGKTATIARTDKVGWSDTMLPFVLSRQTLSASTAETLSIGDGTLSVPDNANVVLSGGYTMNPQSSGAGVLDVGAGATLTVSGAGTATSGGFVKTGAGTLRYTGAVDHTLAIQNQNANGVLDIDSRGIGPTTGYHCAAVAEGTFVIDQPEGGTFKTANNGDGRFMVGVCRSADGSDETAAHLIISNGTVNLGILGIGWWKGDSAPANYPTCTATVEGGTVALAGALRMGYGNAIFTQNGGTVICTNNTTVPIGMGADSTSVMNLNGGVFVARDVIHGNTASTAIINFNGGTWRANGLSDMGINDEAWSLNVCAGGAKFDCSLIPAGQDFYVGGNLLHDPALGATPDGGVTVTAGAIKWLSKASTYTGPTTVKSNATLVVSGGTGINLPTRVVLERGARLKPVNQSATIVLSDDLTMDGGILTIVCDANGNNAKIAVAGTPTLDGQVELVDTTGEGTSIGNSWNTDGTYVFLTYTGADPDVSNLTLANLPEGKVATFAAANGEVSVTLATDAAISWTADANGNLADSENWSGTFASGAGVTFGDAITANRTVTTAGETVDSVTFDNDAASYTLAGSGLTVNSRVEVMSGSHSITAPLTLPGTTPVAVADGASLALGTVSGAGTLRVSGNVTFGDTSGLAGLAVDSGRITLNEIVNDLEIGRGTLYYNGPDATSGHALTLAAGSKNAAIVQNDHNLTLTGDVSCISGAFVKRGAGTLTLSTTKSNVYIGRQTNADSQEWGTDTPAMATGDAPTNGFASVTVVDGTLRLTGSGSFVTGADVYSGARTVRDGEGRETSGELLIDGAGFTVNGHMHVGFVNGTTETTTEPTHSVVRVKSGRATFSNDDSLYICHAKVADVNMTPEFIVDGGTVTMKKLSFGVVTLPADPRTHATMTVNGGTVAITDIGLNFGDRAVTGGVQVPTTFNMNGGAFTAAGGGACMGRYGSVSALNLNGGTFAVKRIFRSGATPGDTTINWNGGVFQPNADGQTSKDIAHVYVSTNGCVVNVTNTMTHTMAFALTRDPALGASADGGVTKLGTGTLSLTSAASDFTGPVNVEGGTLAFAPKMTNDVTVAQGATLSVSGTATVGRVAGAGTVAGGTVEIHGPLAAGSTKVTGNLTVAENAVVDFGGSAHAGDRIALLDVSEAASVSVPKFVRAAGTGRDDSVFRAELSVADGTLYAELKSAQMVIIFR